MLTRVARLAARLIDRGIGPVVPRSRRLGFEYALFRLAGGDDPDLASLERLGPNAGTALDVGANRGLYTHRLARLYSRVHAFEANPALADRLTPLAAGNVTVHPVGLSDHEGTCSFYLPYMSGMLLDGWGSMRADNCPDAERCEHISVPVVPLDSFALTDVRFVKIDVEGYEAVVLRGARDTLTRNRPAVLMEVRGDTAADVADLLAGLDYVEVSIPDRTGRATHPWSHLYWPRS